jgi:hydrogenase maturation protein HypF
LPRQRFIIEGIVQGVGFRPFVYQAAERWRLAGWVLNDSRGVLIEAEGGEEELRGFLQTLQQGHPPLAAISRLQVSDLPATGEGGFVIRESCAEPLRLAQVTPDADLCRDCLTELFDPQDRRYRYPFINCTNCGPRYTIITAIPYDRPHTTMAVFTMCPDCQGEYDDPRSRRFHAQPNACPLCGPRLRLTDAAGASLEAAEPVIAAARLLRQGRIIAIKGLGGYHLAVDAGNAQAVQALRRRKGRDEKPFALMARDLSAVRLFAQCDEQEARLLQGVERPIVLLQRRPKEQLAAGIAPGNRYYGTMLPYTPLHHLLLAEGFEALVMTSANLSDEPMIYDDAEVYARLAGIADYVLLHDRRIHIRADDSIARVMAGRPLLLRRARGYVPRGLLLPQAQPAVLALGAELKNTICFTRGDRAYLSQHIGDLKDAGAFNAFTESIDHLTDLLQVQPTVIAHDLHPDYLSSRHAETLPGRHLPVQHHHAHLASCLAENGLQGPAIGVIFDGSGYGSDGHVWGGEFLVGDLRQVRRRGHFAYLPMPGGDAATKEPLRMTLSYLHRTYGRELPPLPQLTAIPTRELHLYWQMLEKGINAPLTSSCGRLFDAVAALCGLRHRVSYEGQAALELEMVAAAQDAGAGYPFAVSDEEGMLVVEFTPLIRAIVNDLLQGVAVPVISFRFHQGLAQAVSIVCQRLRASCGLTQVALSGGVFQNRLLTELTMRLLAAQGFTVITHSLVPPNDGGVAFGQAVIAGQLLREGEEGAALLMQG